MRLQLRQARRIWDDAPHCAFTDLVRFQGELWCAFREATGHRSPDGRIRIIGSPDGEIWTSRALLESAGEDLRDPKFVVDPKGQLFLACAAVPPLLGSPLRTLLFRFVDECWSPPRAIGDPGVWLWRLTFAPSGIALGVGYGSLPVQFVRLYQTRDLATLSTLVPTLCDQERPSEHALAFEPDGTAICLLRRDPGPGLVGLSRPDYREWTWRELNHRIGGPCLLRLPGGELIASARLHDGEVRTSLCELDTRPGRLTELLALPSGGDTSYPGMVTTDGELFVSYYSSHEGRTAVYFARVTP